jgi:hypothetical protein
MINYDGWQANLICETGTGLVAPPTDAVQSAKRLHSFLYDPDQIKKTDQAAFHLTKT